MGNKKEYTAKEVAALLGVKPTTVLGWIRKGYVAPKDIGKGAAPKYRFTMKMIKNIKERRKTGHSWAI